MVYRHLNLAWNFLLYSLFFWVTSLSGEATNWVDAKKRNSIAYFLHHSSPRIERYDLDSGKWLSRIELSRIPTAFHIDEHYLYVAYHRTLYRYNLEGNEEFHISNFNSDVSHVFSDGDLLFAFYEGVSIFNRATAIKIGEDVQHRGLTYLRQGISHSEESNSFYGRSTGVGPSDIGIMTYTDAGEILSIKDSPHHGAYPGASATWVFPDGSKVVDSSGNVYNAINLNHLNSFATNISALDFIDGKTPIVVIDDQIRAYSSSLLETGRLALQESPQSIFARAEDILLFYPDGEAFNGMNQFSIQLDELKVEETSTAIDPTGLPFKPDDAFMSGDSTLFMLSKAHSSLFRWNIADQSWDTTIPLIGGPDYVAFDEERQLVYTAYNDGRVLKIDLTLDEENWREQPFVNLPSPPLGIIVCGGFVVTADASGAWESHTSFSLDGTRLDYRDWNHPLHDAQWSPIHRRIYHFRDGTSPNDLHWEGLSKEGRFDGKGETPLHGDVRTTYPIRLSPDGTIVLLGSGQIYDALSLAQLTTLPEGLTDAAWVDGKLHTLHDNVVKNWTLPTYSEGLAISFPGTGLRMFSLSNGRFLIMTLIDDGLPQMSIYDKDYDLLPPPTIATPHLTLVRNNAKFVSLKWTNISGEEQFVLERKMNDEASWSVLTTLKMDTSSYTDNDVAFGNMYQYRVKGINDDLESDYSNELKVSLVYEPLDQGPATPPDFSFTPDTAFMGNGRVLYLLAKEQNRLLRWDSIQQRWLSHISLSDAPLSLTYSDINHSLYVLYDDGIIHTIDLRSAPLEESFFGTVTGRFFYDIIAAGEYIIACTADSSWRDLTSFDASGAIIEKVGLRYSINGGFWSEPRRRLYHLRDGISPNDLVINEILLDGKFGLQNDSPYHNSEGIEHPVRVDPDGKIVILGSGRIYDAITLEHIKNLPGAIQDAIWVNGELLTIQGNQVIHYTKPTYERTKAMFLRDTPYRIFNTIGDQFITVAAGEDGRPRIGHYHSDFELVSPDELLAPLLSVNSIEATQVTLHWSDVGGEKTYVIERKEPENSWGFIGSANQDYTTYIDTNVSLGKSYKYRVQAQNDGKTSNYSNEIEASIKSPEIVQGLTASAISESSVSLTWEDTEYENGYRIERRGVGGQWNLVIELEADKVETTDTSVSPGTNYAYRVIALSHIADAAPSASIEITTPIDPPATPSLVNIQVVGPLLTQLQWQDIESEKGYQLERAIHVTGGALEWLPIATLDTNTLSYQDQTTKPGVVYRYRVSAFNAGGSSEPNVSELIEIPQLVFPSVPLVKRKELEDLIYVHLTWGLTGNIKEYDVYRRKSGSSEWNLLDTLSGENTDYMDVTVDIGFTYEYTVVARNELGTTDQSVLVITTVSDQRILFEENFDEGLSHSGFGQDTTGTQLADARPNAGYILYFNDPRTRFAVTPRMSITRGGYISFDFRAGNEPVDGPAWDNSKDGVGVRLEYLLNGRWHILEVLNAAYPRYRTWTHVSIELPNTLDGHEVRFRWVQERFDGMGDQWGLDNVTIVTRLHHPPPPPELVLVGSHQPDSVALFWLPDESADFYIVERAVHDSELWEEIAIINDPGNYYIDHIKASETYFYRVSAGNIAGISSAAPTVVAGALNSLQEWKMREFGNVDKNGVAANEHLHPNGLTTLSLYALNISHRTEVNIFNPEKPEQGGIPRYSINPENGHLTIEFLRRSHPASSGIIYQVNVADQLDGPWEVAGSMMTLPIASGEWEIVTWEDIVSTHQANSRFVKLDILEAPQLGR